VIGSVVWNGALDRQVAEAMRKQAAEALLARPTSQPLPKRVKAADRVVAWLRSHGESTMNDIATGTGLGQHGVNTALYNLRMEGIVETSPYRTVRTAAGRTAKFYRLAQREKGK
jgi:predicted ArsR family transcriptional regulator